MHLSLSTSSESGSSQESWEEEHPKSSLSSCHDNTKGFIFIKQGFIFIKQGFNFIKQGFSKSQKGEFFPLLPLSQFPISPILANMVWKLKNYLGKLSWQIYLGKHGLKIKNYLGKFILANMVWKLRILLRVIWVLKYLLACSDEPFEFAEA